MGRYHWTVADSMNLTLHLVINDGHRMPLRGLERDLALWRMTELGFTDAEISRRLCMDPRALYQFRHRQRQKAAMT